MTRFQRRSIRLKDFDYSETGYYFITICAKNRECLFGGMINFEMRLNDAGQMMEKWWKELNHKFPRVQTDTFAVMPNHFHGIIGLCDVGAALRGRPGLDANIPSSGRPPRGAPTLGHIIDWFKTMTTNAYIRGVRQHGWAPFPGQLWQRNYYERVIRNDDELFQIRQYIQENPLKWDLDPENPRRVETLNYQ